VKIAINGAGIAGTTLAFWLCRTGHEVLLIEQAPHLRSGGYIIDFWGVGYDVAERMGLTAQIRDLGYEVQDVRLVDGHGHTRGGFHTRAIADALHDRFTSVRRSDIAASIYAAMREKVETLFGDSIAGIEQVGNRVRLAFDHASPREVDLVIGADGLHSRVRHLAFAPDAAAEVSLGYHVAAFEIQGYRPRDELVYLTHGVAGRQVSRFSMRGDTTMFLFVFRDGYLQGPAPTGERERKQLLAKVFGDTGWECPRILAALQETGELYFDTVSQVRMAQWSTGRVALVGDAAACVSLLAGEGTGLAMAEAYVLAGELQRCGGDHVAAFANYEQRLMPFLARKQAAAAKFAATFAPATEWGITLRNLGTLLMRIPYLASYFVRRQLDQDVPIPDYGL
jgi:2-polyprenyl-6-methoxyphenol hydroxylase-like FAD-dependent oxidoreductase